jgi:hypothetical protein
MKMLIYLPNSLGWAKLIDTRELACPRHLSFCDDSCPVGGVWVLVIESFPQTSNIPLLASQAYHVNTYTFIPPSVEVDLQQDHYSKSLSLLYQLLFSFGYINLPPWLIFLAFSHLDPFPKLGSRIPISKLNARTQSYNRFHLFYNSF